jgi:hypothetical protein
MFHQRENDKTKPPVYRPAPLDLAGGIMFP